MILNISCSIPKNNVGAEWIKVIELSGRKVVKKTAICSDHFLDECFESIDAGGHITRKLRPDAIPTIFTIQAKISIYNFCLSWAQ